MTAIIALLVITVDMYWKAPSFTNEAAVRYKLLCHSLLKLFCSVLALQNTFFVFLKDSIAVLLVELDEVVSCRKLLKKNLAETSIMLSSQALIHSLEITFVAFTLLSILNYCRCWDVSWHLRLHWMWTKQYALCKNAVQLILWE